MTSHEEKSADRQRKIVPGVYIYIEKRPLIMSAAVANTEGAASFFFFLLFLCLIQKTARRARRRRPSERAALRETTETIHAVRHEKGKTWINTAMLGTQTTRRASMCLYN